MPDNDITAATLAELASVRGHLQAIATQLHLNSEATNRRIDDLRHSVEGRLSGHEKRIDKLENNERGTAIKVAGIAAGSSALVSGVIALLKGHP